MTRRARRLPGGPSSAEAAALDASAFTPAVAASFLGRPVLTLEDAQDAARRWAAEEAPRRGQRTVGPLAFAAYWRLAERTVRADIEARLRGDA
jgi:hypothetical protein